MANRECALCADASAPLQTVDHYKIQICAACATDNAHGWDPKHEPVLRQALSAAGLFIPDRTADERWPFRYAPPADFQL